MSLDISLSEPNLIECDHCKKETTYPDFEVFSSNITHNLGGMAGAAGIYKALWRPEEINIKMAKDLIPLLQEGLNKLIANPSYYKTFNASNGWGMYEHFVPFVREYLEACEAHPDAVVDACR